MEQTGDITTTPPERLSFDVIEIAGLLVPLLLAITTIVLVALNPDPSNSASKASKPPSEKLEQIHRR